MELRGGEHLRRRDLTKSVILLCTGVEDRDPASTMILHHHQEYLSHILDLVDGLVDEGISARPL